MNWKIHYSWIIMISCFLLMADLGLQLSLVSVFLKPISESIGVTRTMFSSCHLISGLFGMFSGMQASKLYRRFSMRRILLFGAGMSTLGVLSYSLSTQLWHFYLAAPIYGFGNGLTSTIPASILLTNWFQEKRGTASSAAFMGSSLGNLIFTQIAVRLLLVLEWRRIYQIFALVKLGIMVPTILFLIVETPAQRGLSPYGGYGIEGGTGPETQNSHGITTKIFLKTPVFYCIAFSTFISAIYILGVQNHLQSFLTDIGFSPVWAANALSLLFCAQISGKFLVGVVLDKFGIKFSVFYVTVLFLIGCLCLVGTSAIPVLAFAAVTTIGLAGGQVTIFPPYITSELVGAQAYPAIIGIIQIFNSLGTNINSTFTSILYDTFHGYALAWVLYMIFSVAAATSYLCALRLRKSYKI